MECSHDFQVLRDRAISETFVRSFEAHEEIGSTNTRALELAGRRDVEHPCLVIADRQTAGRGRGANRWWSSSGSLTFSLLMRPDVERLPLARWPELSLTVGSAVCASVSSFIADGDVRLKWPNDVFLNGRKVCGILVEVPPSSTGSIVVGIGLNINNSVDHAPEELRQTAVSLCDVYGEQLSVSDVLVSVVQELERQFNWLSDDVDRVRQAWRKHDLLLGRTLTIGDERKTVTGTATGIDDDGALLLQTEAGLQRMYGGAVQSFE
ncbi:MAG: biotin--[acetyl-CoA-carboxylase] ligase [Planctomycetaceae bacterium]|nr:biotin--[acetyl-CoA-carboxylase] ligase [Planctomycetaceae bacterium]